ncbi:hypothetical protein LAZ67_X003011 [Cordylochernes scorpioides]|uniref:Uncharacterized protein n=1 Tax=Cordylochernes scorpioides TaxID=51811 RepID=A0ABY6LU37_9ARAC|nr:hypothetical protein LAZ67_X003011 [Cordylochernes scorpioides]
MEVDPAAPTKQKTPSRKASSFKSGSSTKSVVLMKKAEVDADREIMNKMKEKDQHEIKMGDTHMNLDRSERELARLKEREDLIPELRHQKEELEVMIIETELKMRREIRAFETLEFELALLKNEKDSKLLAIQEGSDQDLFSEEEAVDGSLQAGLRAQEWVHPPPPFQLTYGHQLQTASISLWTYSRRCFNSNRRDVLTISEPVNDNDIHEFIKSSFSTENFGVIPRTRWQGMNQVEGRAYDILQKTTKRTEACWETGLLWHDAEGTLPESYQMAIGRLRHTERKLAKDLLLLAAYKAKFDEYLEKGYIRKLDSIEVTKGSERMWYIPHFGVTNPNKPGKLRLVFDAAARSNGVSLNEALSKGPDLIRPLTSVLWNFQFTISR